jgi:hypothetical protein
MASVILSSASRVRLLPEVRQPDKFGCALVHFPGWYGFFDLGSRSTTLTRLALGPLPQSTYCTPLESCVTW